MPRPLGSKNKPKEIVTDGYAQAFTGAGTSKDRSTFTRAKSASLLQQSQLQDMYIGDGFARRIVDIPAEEMTRAGISFENMDSELEESICSKFEELSAMRHMNDAVRWSRLFGGAVMVYGVNDGGTLDMPLNENGIKSVEFLRVYDRWQATIQKRYTDPLEIKYGSPELWMISPVNGGSPYIVHESRVHMFDGDAIPDLARSANLGWGASVLQACYDQLIRLGMSHQWANMLLERSQQAVHKIPALSNVLRSPGGEQMIQKRVDVVDMVRGILNTIIIDADESYDVTSQTMAGVNELLDRFAEALSAVSGIPVTLLMGRAPGGLSSTGKADLDNWYARISSMQSDILRDPIDKLVTYIAITKTGADGGDYQVCFNPLVVLSASDKAEIDNKEASTKKILSEANANYVGIGAISVDEVRSTLLDEYELTDDSLKIEESDLE